MICQKPVTSKMTFGVPNLKYVVKWKLWLGWSPELHLIQVKFYYLLLII